MNSVTVGGLPVNYIFPLAAAPSQFVDRLGERDGGGAGARQLDRSMNGAGMGGV